MQRSRLIAVLKTLDMKSHTRFGAYVASPFFNKNEKVRRLCVYLLQFAPDFEHAALQKRRYTSTFFKKKTTPSCP